jgi:hypothetical protein
MDAIFGPTAGKTLNPWVKTAMQDENVEKRIEALEELNDYAEEIDKANALAQKFGGFEVGLKCVNSGNAKERVAACNLISTICKNNATGQQILLAKGGLKMLTEKWRTEKDDLVQCKLMGAISSAVLNQPEALKVLEVEGGLGFLGRLLREDQTSLKSRERACFFGKSDFFFFFFFFF